MCEHNCSILMRTGLVIGVLPLSSKSTLHLTYAVRMAWTLSISPLHEHDVKLSQWEALKGYLVFGPCLLLLLLLLPQCCGFCSALEPTVPC